MSRHDKRNGFAKWMGRAKQRLDREDMINVPERELDQLGSDMLKAVTRAKDELTARQARRGPVLVARWAAAAVAVCVLGLVWLQIAFNRQPVVAAGIAGVEGIVVSASAQKPVAGVVIRRMAATDQATSLSDANIVDITDVTGLFSLPADRGADECRYVFEVDGEQVGCLQSANDERTVRDRFVRVEIGDPRNDSLGKFKYPISLAPGDSSVLSDAIRLAQSAGATESWEGHVIHDLAWPSVFNHARIVDGIFILDGPPADSLTLSIAIPADKLTYLGASLDELRLIAFDEDCAADPCTGAAWHHGWYYADDPPMERGLPAVDLLIESSNAGCQVTWAARPGVAYALLLPPQADGELLPCYLGYMQDAAPTRWTKSLLLGDFTTPQMSLYDLYYEDPAGVDSGIVNPLPLHPQFQLNLEVEHLRRDGPGKREAFATLGEEPVIPGLFTLKRYDFLYSEEADYQPLAAVFSRPTSDFAIAVEQGVIGEETRLAITGDLTGLTDRIAWDFDGDRVADTWGETTQLFVPSACAYEITATVKTADAVYIVSRALTFTNDQVVGFRIGRNGPILKGLSAPPPAETSWISMTPDMRARQVAYGYSASRFLGPVMLIDPPAEFRHKPLSQLRIVLLVSGMAGETGVVHLVPDIVRVSDARATGTSLMAGIEPMLSDYPEFIDCGYGNLSREVDIALAAKRSGKLLTSYYTELMNAGLIDNPRQAAYQLALGLDLADLPDEDRLYNLLQDFKASEFYSIRYAQAKKQEITWTCDLHDLELDAQDGLLAGVLVETSGALNDAQWELYSGGTTPARVEIIAQNGSTYTTYIDYSVLY